MELILSFLHVSAKHRRLVPLPPPPPTGNPGSATDLAMKTSVYESLIQLGLDSIKSTDHGGSLSYVMSTQPFQ